MLRRTCALPSIAFALSLFAATGAADAAQRTFVSTAGNDANACSLVAPCRGFAKAITVTGVGGELVVLDSGGYGSVTVNKDVTIVSPAGVYAGISVSAATDGITVAAPATKVVLRGLTINGQGGDNGIRVQAGEVHVESTVISNMTQAGILVEGGSTVRISGTVSRSNGDGLRVAPTTGSVSVLVRDCEFSNNTTAGIGVSPSPAGSSAQVTVERSSLTRNGAGIVTASGTGTSATVVVTQSVASENLGAGVSASGNTANVFVRESALTRNGTGLLQAASGQLTACGANLLVANSTAQSGSINVNAAACLDQLAGGTGTVTSVGTGAGLTGGPITTAGTIAVDTTAIQARVTGTCAVGNYVRAIAADGTVTCQPDSTGPANAFVQGGNAFGATAVFGTTDANALDIQVNGSRVMRYEPNAAGPNVVGGHPNNSAGAFAGQTIAGGGGTTLANQVNGDHSTIGGGEGNIAGNSHATIGGGVNNHADVQGTVGGGSNNSALNGQATVGGGNGNFAEYGGTIGGGYGNYAELGGTVAGGSSHHAGYVSTIGGGVGNTAYEASAIGGGTSNLTGASAVVGGGSSNRANAMGSTIGGGIGNYAGGVGPPGSTNGSGSTVVGGSGNTASGLYSTVGGGNSNTASGAGSFAAGYRAKTQTAATTPVTHDGAFVWADYNEFDFNSAAANEFAVRATGGVRLVLGIDGAGAPTWTCAVASGGSWACSSDRNQKQNLRQLDGQAVLAQLATMPIYSWTPKGENAHLRHFGPTAQDFYATFGLGDSELRIGQQDADGVALAAIQGLNTKVAEQQRQIAELSGRVQRAETLAADVGVLNAAMKELQRTRSNVAAK